MRPLNAETNKQEFCESPTCIDLIITNKPRIFVWKAKTYETSLSDFHKLVCKGPFVYQFSRQGMSYDV